MRKWEEENYLSSHNVVDWKSTYFVRKLKKCVIDNGISTVEENKEINTLKINCAHTHKHSKYNTKTCKRKLKNSEKFERIGNTKETYPIPISK